ERVDGVAFRYHAPRRACRLVLDPSSDGATVALEESVDGVAPGQLACLMDGDLVVGHGTIVQGRKFVAPARANRVGWAGKPRGLARRLSRGPRTSESPTEKGRHMESHSVARRLAVAACALAGTAALVVPSAGSAAPKAGTAGTITNCNPATNIEAILDDSGSM